MGMIKFLVGFAFAALFTISIVSYTIGFANDNNADVSLASNSDLASLSSNIESNLTQYNLDVDTASQTYSESKMQSGNDNIEAGTPFKLGPANIIGTIKTIFSSVQKEIFGTKTEFTFIFNTIIAFIVAISIYYGWQLWKGGTP
jgi:hypothetical protein